MESLAAPYAEMQPLRILPASDHPSSGRSGVARIASVTVLIGSVVLIVAASAGIVLGAWRFTVIQTGSMRPTLNPGDVAILTSEPVNDVKRGQIVAFHPPGEPQLTVTHRVFSINRAHGAVIIATKGDANSAVDHWHARLTGSTAWRETAKVPMMGYLAVWSYQRPVRLGVLAVIVLLVTSMLLGSIWRSNRP